MIGKLTELQAETLIITDTDNVEAARDRRAIVLPVALDEIFTPIPYIVPAQLFAVSLAEEKGLNPDQPRAVSKVTRTM
jgi:glucosamine--fructose-6-phosphate aminotransferase (isomerizing)